MSNGVRKITVCRSQARECDHRRKTDKKLSVKFIPTIGSTVICAECNTLFSIRKLEDEEIVSALEVLKSMVNQLHMLNLNLSDDDAVSLKFYIEQLRSAKFLYNRDITRAGGTPL